MANRFVLASPLAFMFILSSAFLSAGCPGPEPESCSEAIPLAITSSMAEPVNFENQKMTVKYLPEDGRVGLVARKTDASFATSDLLVWDGLSWTRRGMAVGPYASSLATGPFLSSMDGKFVGIRSLQRTGDGVLGPRAFTELSNGTFSEEIAQPLPLESLRAMSLRSDGLNRLISATFDFSSALKVLEKVGESAWVRSTVSSGGPAILGSSIDAGYDQNGSAWIVFRGDDGKTLKFSRRTGAIWTAPVTLKTATVDEQLISTQVFQLPLEGGDQGIVVSYILKTVSSVRVEAIKVNPSTGTASPFATLMSLNGNFSVFSNVDYVTMSFSQDGSKGVFGIHHPGTHNIVLGSYLDGAFSSTTEAFKSSQIMNLDMPSLYHDSCDRPILVHRLRDFGVAEIEAPIQFDQILDVNTDGI